MSEASNATEEIQSNSKIRLSIWQALVPIIALVGMLAYNVFIYGEDSLGGSNQFILLMGGAVAAIVGVVKGLSLK